MPTALCTCTGSGPTEQIKCESLDAHGYYQEQAGGNKETSWWRERAEGLIMAWKQAHYTRSIRGRRRAHVDRPR